MLEKNRKALEELYPEYLPELDIFNNTSSTVKAVKAEDYSWVFQKQYGETNWYSLSNLLNPKTEAQESIATAYTNNANTDHLFIMGMGSGYEVLEACKQNKTGWIILFEPDFEIFRLNATYHDLTPFLKRPNTFLILGNEKQKFSNKIFKFLSQTLIKNIICEVNRNAAGLYGHIYQEYLQEFQSSLNRFQVNLNTSMVFGKRFAYNMLRNTPFILESGDIKSYKDSFEKKPTVIVSAGPSLTDSIEDLKRIQDKALIICVDSALKVLLESGIQPHFVTTIDIQSRKSKIFHWATKHYPEADFIVTQIQYTHPRITKSHKGKRLFMWVESPVSNWLMKSFGKQHDFGETLSCAHAALYLAQYLGSDPIIFVGQDLCYSAGDNQRHAKGTIGTHSEIPGGHRYKWESDPSACKVKGNDGQEYKSSRTLAAFIKTFEVSIFENSQKVYNATKKGAKIEGAEWKELATLESENVFEEEFDFKKHRDSLYKQDFTIVTEKTFEKNINNLITEIKKYKKHFKELGKVSSRAKKVLNKSKMNLQDQLELEKVEKERLKLESKINSNNSIMQISQQPMLATNLKIRDMEEEINKTKDPLKKAKLVSDKLIFISKNFSETITFFEKVFKIVKKKLHKR